MIDTEALRKKVIDLAIQGKLTEQLPTDGNAEDLYARIQEEKARLIKEGKIKKDKFLSETTDLEIPFVIPCNWKWLRFGEITFIERGGSPRPIKSYITDSDDGINWIKIGDVEKGGKYIYSTKEKIIPEGEKKSRRVYPGDFLLTNSMSFGRPYISKVEGCIHDGWLLIRDLKGFCADYLYYLLSSSYMYGQFCNKASGATVDNLNIDKVNSAMIPLPPIDEQKRIADVIEKIDALIKTIDDLQTKYSNDLAVLKSKIIDAGIRGKLTEQLPEDGDAEDLYNQIQEEKAKLIKEGKIKKEKPLPEITEDEIPFEIPKNWKWVRIADIGLTFTGTTPPKTNTEYYGGEYPFFKPSDLDMGNHITVGSESLSDDGWKVSRQLKKGSILVCCIGSIGKCAIIDVDGTTNQQINALTPIVCNSDYLLYAISNDLFQSQLQRWARATTVVIIKKSKFDECIIPLPPKEEQRRIVDKINEMLRIVT